MPETVRKDMMAQMEKSIEALKANLVKIQTGRANPAMIEDIHVSYYGAMTPLKQMATIAAPDANLLVIQPYDKSQMSEVEKAILAADLGLNPQSDGMVIRVKVPKLSEERRRELTKTIKARGEETKVALRNIRRDANDRLDQLKKDGDISEDDHRRHRDKNDDAIHDFTSQVDELIDAKGTQIQTV